MTISFNTNSFTMAHKKKEKINSADTLNFYAKNSNFNKTEYIVYLKTNDMLYSGGSYNGLSFTIKYAENSSKENPIVKAKGIDQNGKAFEQTININDIDLLNASIIEMRALENHLKLDKSGRLSTLPYEVSNMHLNDKNNFVKMFEDATKEQIKLRQYDLAMIYKKSLKAFSDFINNQKKFS